MEHSYIKGFKIEFLIPIISYLEYSIQLHECEKTKSDFQIDREKIDHSAIPDGEVVPMIPEIPPENENDLGLGG